MGLSGLFVLAMALAMVATACSPSSLAVDQGEAAEASTPAPPVPDGAATAVFAGGCFWCMEPVFEALDGVHAVTSGYTGVDAGALDGPAPDGFDHVEAVQIRYDPERVTYERLLRIYWRNINPTDEGGQFYDRGDEYRTAIFYLDETQRGLAEESRNALAASGRFDGPVATRILPAGAFQPAEAHHQDYYKKNPEAYKSYRKGSGRDDYFERLWGDDE